MPKEILNGEVHTIQDDLQVYYSAPSNKESKKAIILIYDIFGFTGGQIRGICDQLASAGFHVVMPNLYRNETGIMEHGGLFPSPGKFLTDDGMAWVKSITAEKCLNDLAHVHEFIKNKCPSVKAIGSLGFCWGAWVGFHQAASGKIQAAAGCHPSVQIEEQMFGGSLEKLTKV